MADQLTSSDVGALARGKINTAIEQLNDLATQFGALNTAVTQRALQADLTDLSEEVNTKAAQSAVTTLQTALNQAVADLQSALQNEEDSRTAAISDLIARILRINAGLYPSERPGETPTAFTASRAGGEPDALAPLDPALYPLRVVGDGLGRELSNSREIWERALHAVEPTRLWRGRWRYVRTTNASDPEDDAVAALIQWYDANRNTVGGPVTVEAFTPQVSTGPHEYTAFIGLAGVTGVTIARPNGAVYCRLGVKAFGVESRTVVTDLAAVDVSSVEDAIRRLVPDDALPSLSARIDDLVQDLAAEAGTREAEDVALDQRFTAAFEAELQARVAADIALGQRIDLEEAQREAEDVALDQRFTAAIQAELEARVAEDVALDARLDPIEAGDFSGAIVKAKEFRILGQGAKARSARAFDWPILDSAGRVLMDLASKRFGGLPYLLGEFVQRLPKRLPRRARRFGVPLFIDATGRVSAWLQSDGLFSAVVGGEFAHRINEGTRGRPIDFGFYQGVMYVRVESKLVRGIRQEPDGFVSEIVRRVPQLYATAAITDHALPIECNMVIGQSQAGGGDVVPILTDALYPHHVFTLDANGYAYGDAAFFEPASRDFVPVADTWMAGPQYFATMLGFAMERMRRDQGTPSPGYLMLTDWYGGQPLSSFLSGTPQFANTVSHAKTVGRIAAKYGRSVIIRAIVFKQGESGPVGRSAYLAMLVPYVDSQLAAIVTAAGGNGGVTPHWIMCQINNGDTDAATGVELAQLDFARSRLGNGVTLYGPMYQHPIIDQIHMDKRMGQCVDAEMAALARRYVVDEGRTFNPLWSASATRTGNIIDITYATVYGAGALAFDLGGPQVPSLVQNADPDQGWVYPPVDGTKGFTFTDDSGSPPTVTGVTITGANTVQITLSGTPTGANKRVRYALQTEGVADNWVSGRGLLYRPTSEPSVYYRLGRPVPPTLRHYAVREEIPVT